MSNKYRILIIIGVIIVVAVAGQLSWMWLSGRSEKETIEPDSQTNQVLDKLNEVEVSQEPKIEMPSQNSEEVKSANQDDLEKQKVEKIANSFAAIFGSYSNQANFENLKDLKFFMSEKMRLWADNYISEHMSDSTPKIYFGVTTKSLKAEFVDFNNQTAKISIYTQRKESTGTKDNSRVYYQYLELAFVKEKGVWKIDGAYWK